MDHTHVWVRCHDGYDKPTNRAFCTRCPIGAVVIAEGPGTEFHVIADDYEWPERPGRLVAL